MAEFKTLDDLEVSGKRVLVRADLNVPMKDGAVSNATRIERLVPTLSELAGKGARVIVASHFGRPKGKKVAEMSLKPLAGPLGEALGKTVAFAEDCIGEAAAQTVDSVEPSSFALLENLRFHAGEEANDPDFAFSISESHGQDPISDFTKAVISVFILAVLQIFQDNTLVIEERKLRQSK